MKHFILVISIIIFVVSCTIYPDDIVIKNHSSETINVKFSKEDTITLLSGQATTLQRSESKIENYTPTKNVYYTASKYDKHFSSCIYLFNLLPQEEKF
jgi:hypothetical protein